jgi:hypothetical protein
MIDLSFDRNFIIRPKKKRIVLRRVCVFTAALIVFTLGGENLCPFPVISEISWGPILKFVDRDHCQ